MESLWRHSTWHYSLGMNSKYIRSVYKGLSLLRDRSRLRLESSKNFPSIYRMGMVSSIREHSAEAREDRRNKRVSSKYPLEPRCFSEGCRELRRKIVLDCLWSKTSFVHFEQNIFAVGQPRSRKGSGFTGSYEERTINPLPTSTALFCHTAQASLD